ncbi:MAG TPA: glycosyltransferase family 29 protein [Pseudomonadales bacterium]
MSASGWQRLAASAALWRGRRRRARGRYDRCTRRLLQRAARFGGPSARLDYALFRRDLGHPLHPRLERPLHEALPALRRSKRWNARALLREADSSRASDDAAAELGIGVAEVAARQEQWRDGFRRALAAAAATRGICVVGNAGALAGTRLGETIDTAGVVIRFNDFGLDGSADADIGRRTTVWVTNPGYRGPRFDRAEWVVISGPDVSYRLRDWSRFEERVRRGEPLLTVPLDVWRDLVRVLHAPPSAGVLMLAWLHALLDSWTGISAAGIGVNGGAVYHLRRSYRRSNRHDWAAEASLVARWVDSGLTRLPSAGLPLAESAR